MKNKAKRETALPLMSFTKEVLRAKQALKFKFSKSTRLLTWKSSSNKYPTKVIVAQPLQIQPEIRGQYLKNKLEQTSTQADPSCPCS